MFGTSRGSPSYTRSRGLVSGSEVFKIVCDLFSAHLQEAEEEKKLAGEGKNVEHVAL